MTARQLFVLMIAIMIAGCAYEDKPRVRNSRLRSERARLDAEDLNEGRHVSVR